MNNLIQRLRGEKSFIIKEKVIVIENKYLSSTISSTPEEIKLDETRKYENLDNVMPLEGVK